MTTQAQAWLRMGGGFVAMSAFAGAGCACTWRAVSAAVYVGLVLFALLLFAVVVVVPDDRWSLLWTTAQPSHFSGAPFSPGPTHSGFSAGHETACTVLPLLHTKPELPRIVVQ